MGDGLFFVISKLFWLLARPESVLVVLVAFSLLYRRWVGCLALGLMLAIGLLPVADAVLAPLERAYPANPAIEGAHGLIILGGASQGSLSERWGVPAMNQHGERFLAALSLAHANPELEVVFTGGSGSLVRRLPGEAASAEEILLATGLDAARLRIEGASRNTAENAVFTRALLGAEANKRWVLVTSAFHMPRSVATFCAAGWAQVIPYPVDFLSEPGRNWLTWRFAERLGHMNLGVKEWIGRIAYRLSGRASDDACAVRDD